jgi:hypothetical protein
MVSNTTSKSKESFQSFVKSFQAWNLVVRSFTNMNEAAHENAQRQ